MTGREALNKAAGSLLAVDREDGARIARLLLEEVLGISAAELVAALPRQIGAGVFNAYEDLVARAMDGEPAQYIIGHWDFYGRQFKTDRRALIPRPETELLVEAALSAAPADTALQVIDAGCGTGCIGISMKLERPAAHVVLCDLSVDALELASENAALLGANVTLVNADMRLKLPGSLYDIIVSNPPYIASIDMERLPRVVRQHEPRLALHGGDDGLDFVRVLADRAGDSLKPNGSMFIEVGYDQAIAAMDIMKKAGMSASAMPDYSGILRVIAARKGQ